MIHVCFALYDKTGRYSKFTGTAMLSIFENTTSEVTVHILHDNTLPQDSRDKFIYIAGRYGQTVKFYNVEILCADKINEFVDLMPTNLKTSWTSIATIYRFLIPYVVPAGVDKCIYLDSDIIVNLDIVELWKIDLGNKVLAVNSEMSNGEHTGEKYGLCRSGFVKPEDYFNAGVLLINVKLFNEEMDTIKNGMRFVTAHPEALFLDQDVLNYCFGSKSLYLSTKFNRHIRWARWQKETTVDKKIYHYTGAFTNVSFGLDMRDPFNRMWMDYFIKTPFFDTDAIGRLYMSLEQFHVNLKQLMIQLSTSLLGKTRAFFVPPGSLDAIKKIFTIRNNEEIILAENQDSLKKLLNAMKKSRGKKVFFILMNGFPLGLLVQAGFVYGKDFVDGMQFLSEVHGVPMDSHQLIKAM